uniref:Transmembrane protein n=1 Tax=Eucampia antarctica TaxID=49252 RepID=A0A7S2SL30_9STRA|mmetsp:Transcript_9785/g.9444  ORF Transcript_9785/g.9444 Transcript_9785/m.9444 type:complete len:206 (+) Transcript_9785:270-887(+)|eukprot:CAMPEP_0197827206 /NCGR_PEP_ID=MMETSP1437-20131217/4036_1 /TAXON_ID=49252 ORGANISM="Eucampia antarctica, Strain CCMP1452" /NCGR_SAMPLE_ID=MMETSP1437 /ASSEMBLY_ACC=CAM_ASM_001096 /LENGTH=205 /DNA_ID=CAMNT_0043427961 /DNA_START=270 /DNA_END=887 /DNA_ORIENTATION=+
MSAFISAPLRVVHTYTSLVPSCRNSLDWKQPPIISHNLYAFSSNSIASYMDETLTASSTSLFEPVLPDTTTLIGFGCVVLLSVVAAFVWANEVVPVSRQKLAISKRNGDVKEYLDELKEASLLDSDEELSSKPNDVLPNVGDGRDLERWLFSDWLNKNKQPKNPAIPFVLKKAKWNSGDNPVLVASALIFAGVLAGALSERAGSF